MTTSPVNSIFVVTARNIIFEFAPGCLVVETIPNESLLNVQYEQGNYFEK